jgi:hypothetical protein
MLLQCRGSSSTSSNTSITHELLSSMRVADQRCLLCCYGQCIQPAGEVAKPSI